MSEIRYMIHGSKSLVPMFDVLWKNSSPGAEFAAQDVKISVGNAGDYNLLMVVYKDKYGVAFITDSAIVCDPVTNFMNASPIANSLSRISRENNAYFTRPFTVSYIYEAPYDYYLTLSFSDATSTEFNGTTTTVNTNCVPYAILGAKI